jgi:DNA-binding transcriptional LysR family regulator
MEHRLLRSFVAVAEELHFGRAAKRLHISQPPLSAQIRKLEDDLGVRLFERDRRGVALTEAGTSLLGRARHLVAEAERAAFEVRRVARGEAGVLAIGYSAAATHRVLPRVVPLFRRKLPNVQLDLREMKSADQADAVREGRIELGLVCAPTPNLDARDLVEHPLVREKCVVVLPAKHRLAKADSVHVRELEGEPYVGVRPDVEPSWAVAAMRALHDAGVRVTVAQETDGKIAMLGLVAAGVGLSVVSESMTELARRGVVYRPLRGLTLRLVLAALCRPTPSPRATTFLELARPRSA